MHRLTGSVLAFLLLLTACGGGDSNADDDSEGSSDAATTADDGGSDDQSSDRDDPADASGSGDEGPVPLTGAVAYYFSTPYAIDTATSSAVALGPLGGASDPTKFARGADAAYIVVRVTDPENFDLATESLVRVDAATGETTTLAVLQDIDAASGATPDVYRRILPTEGAVGLMKQSGDTTTIEVLDDETGEVVSSIPANEYSDAVTDGTAYYSQIFGGLVRVDPASGERTEVIAEGTAFRDLAPDADLVAATITEDGAPLSAENAEALEQLVSRVEIDLGNAVFVDDGIWWIASRFGISFQDGTAAIHEALAFYDVAAGAITTYAPTGAFGARFLPDDADFDVATLGDAEMVVVDGSVFINDTPLRTGDDSGALLQFDPAAQAFSVFYEPDLAGADFAELTLLDTAPDGLWVLVQRFTVTEENADGSRSSSFETEVVQLDPLTGAELGAVPLR